MPSVRVDSTKSLLDDCLSVIGEFNARRSRDPMAIGVRQLAVELLDQLDSGAQDIAGLEALVKAISDAALRERAHRLGAAAPAGSWRDVVEAALAPLKGAPLEEIKRALEAPRAGVVFTGHPTFSLPRETRAALAALASDAAAEIDFTALEHAPDANLTLRDEHADARASILRAQAALRGLTLAVLDWLEKNAPGHWWSVKPALVRLATWVGYDLDGRTDIHWAETIRIRLAEKGQQLLHYAEALNAAGAGEKCAALADRLARAGAASERLAAYFEKDLDDPETVVAAANALTAAAPDRLTTLTPEIEELGASIAAEQDTARRKALCVVRAEMANYGLGIGGIHLRVNASQVRSAVQADLGLSVVGDFFDRRALKAAAAKAAGAKRQQVNFGSIFREKMTARRQFMLCAEILKHIDADAPIRFLIAEIESPATILGAIYLARLYGAYDRLDISPLFETPEVLERGGRFMEKMLEEEEYLAYVRHRGRLCVQLGFSDSGRFMGQIAANLAIERFHVLLCRALAKRGVRDVEVVIFNTGGESMGRGGYPGTMEQRLDHLLTPWSRARFADSAIAIHPELSFQGGDGYLRFETPVLAAATLRAITAWAFKPPNAEIRDAFYDDINFSWDVYRAIKSWQEALFANPAYQAVLGSFAPNLLPATGSRKSRRQSGASKDDVARSLRAIPHNAILQQLAAPGNVSGGLGAAAIREPERFAADVKGSARLAHLVGMALAARRLTSLSILRTYANVYSPSFWSVRAAQSEDRRASTIALRIAERLEVRGLDVSIERLANVLSSDRTRFDAVQRGYFGAAPGEKFPHSLYVLHAVRLALVMKGLMLTASTPTFSPRHDMTRETLIDQALELRFSEVATALTDIFPISADVPAAFAGLLEPGDLDATGYPEIERDIAAPLAAIDRAIKRITIGISHFYDAFG